MIDHVPVSCQDRAAMHMYAHVTNIEIVAEKNAISLSVSDNEHVRKHKGWLGRALRWSRKG